MGPGPTSTFGAFSYGSHAAWLPVIGVFGDISSSVCWEMQEECDVDVKRRI